MSTLQIMVQLAGMSRTWSFSSPRIVIGKADDCDLPLNWPGFREHHLEIDHNGERVRIRAAAPNALAYLGQWELNEVWHLVGPDAKVTVPLEGRQPLELTFQYHPGDPPAIDHLPVAPVTSTPVLLPRKRRPSLQTLCIVGAALVLGGLILTAALVNWRLHYARNQSADAVPVTVTPAPAVSAGDSERRREEEAAKAAAAATEAEAIARNMTDRGLVLHEGRWMTPDEKSAAEGYVQVDGKWVTPAERDRVMADRARAVAERDRLLAESALATAESAAQLQREQEQRLATTRRLEDDKAQPKPPATAEAEKRKGEAYAMSQVFIKRLLESPRAAKFQDLGSRDVSVAYADGWYTVRATVDAPNSYGTLLRQTYVCKLRPAGDDQWEAERAALIDE